MSLTSRAPTRRVLLGKWIGRVSGILVAAVFGLSLLAAQAPVLADGGLETQKGGLFHRKGWITPAIYRKAERKKPKFSTDKRSNLGAPARKKIAARAATRKSRPKTRTAKAKRSAPSTRAKRRIPARIVRKRERIVAKNTRSKSPRKSVRVASLGKKLALPKPTQKKKKARITGGSGRVVWAASSGCVPSRLKAAINYVARNFGRVRVNSTCRSRRHNRRVGGASQSWHLKSRAADLRVFGNIGKAARYLRQLPGGFTHYGGGLFHIDTGPDRSW